MHRKISGSLAFRLPALYKKLLWLKPIGAIPGKGQTNLVVLMMTGKRFIEMTRMSVKSIASSWSVLPELIIQTDGTISASQIGKKLNFWPGKMTIKDWTEVENFHLDKKRDALVRYANADPFGKKLALILCFAEFSPVLWIDSDILFFNDFIPFLPKENTGFICGGTEDFTAAYHEKVVKITGNNLYERYKFNAGLLYVSGKSIYEDFNLDDIIAAIHPNYDFCTEQSIFAHIASKSKGIIWSRDIVKSYNNDVQSIKPMNTAHMIARHYTSNVRHLFWRDSFFRL